MDNCAICGKALSNCKRRDKKKYCSVKCKRAALQQRRKQFILTRVREEMKKMRANKECYKWHLKYKALEKSLVLAENILKKKRELYPSQIINKPKEDVNDRYVYKGRSTCANYNDNDINCVMCFENAECKFRNCFKEPK